jgi:hypothetical protein
MQNAAAALEHVVVSSIQFSVVLVFSVPCCSVRNAELQYIIIVCLFPLLLPCCFLLPRRLAYCLCLVVVYCLLVVYWGSLFSGY